MTSATEKGPQRGRVRCARQQPIADRSDQARRIESDRLITVQVFKEQQTCRLQLLPDHCWIETGQERFARRRQSATFGPLGRRAVAGNSALLS